MLVAFVYRRWFLVVLGIVLLAGYTQASHLKLVADQVWLRNTIVATVLFLMSLPLSFAAMWGAVRRPAPALLASLLNVGILPLLAWPLAMALNGEMGIGLLIAAATPCTLASAAVWTRRAGGNDAVALMVTLITNLTCFLTTPFWLYHTTGTKVQIDPGEMALKLVLLVVVPIVLAQLVRLWYPLGRWASNQKIPLGVLAQFGVLSMIGIGAVKMGLELESRIDALVTLDKQLMVAAVMTVHLTMLAFGFLVARLLKMTRPDSIAVGISGSQKTLMVGLHIAATYYGPLALLPMVVYHVGQLLADTLIADWLRARGKAASK